ncbi:MAG: BamA/TamA family outer membrane protein [Pseudomonadota bacterium]
MTALVASATAQQSYEVEFRGAKGDLTPKFNILSDLKKGLRDYPTVAALRRAAKRDAEAFDAAMTAAGYYAGTVEFEIERPEGDGKPKVIFNIAPGAAFRVTEYDILYKDDGEGRPSSLETAKIKPNGSAAGADLRNVQVEFLNHLWDSGYPAAKITARRAIAEPEKGTASAVFEFESGPKAHFGEIRISGLTKTDEDYIAKLKTWEPDAEYERAKIVAYRDRLSESGLFSTIEVSPGAPEEDGAAPIIVELEERKRRTIGAGVSFDTDVGPGGRLFFENRNIFGRGENLRIELRGSRFEQSIDFTAQKPFPKLPGFAFANFGFANETTDAFDARSVRLSGGLAKLWLDDRLETRGALALETSNIEANGEEERTFFVSAPLSAAWNSEDDLLQPTKGFRARFTATPYTGTDSFTQFTLSGRSRVFFGEEDRFTLAGRAEVGATFGSSLTSLPLNKRFYAGGGGSIRGFGFQEAGPLDAEDDPIGGRSIITAGSELRGKITKNIQLAGFVDAGSVSSKAFLDFNERFFVGYGVGARYLSPIGPVRFDIAFPVDPRPTDAPLQIYIALGQPF